ncbi:antibiotic biosynthesis monooxygenase [Flavobacterium sp. CLA17]|uniref:antibiotic biosynthesis monooxygenase n=1 Tax=Flavobacterium sp. CLA17 TaxID=2724135 RepID=UPI0014930937|nr:antibiotic biosynthesis monooxygenase [Flavobacterium sp. CLA17]QSB28630.1 antibiotic biosynthesis monooxygenase [Flavobacterium sp. CLA17]
MTIKTSLSILRIVLIVTSLSVGGSPFAAAQNSGNAPAKAIPEAFKNQEMAAQITRYEVKKDDQEKFQKALKEYVSAALSNEENIMAEAYFEKENQAVIWLFERWNNQKELEQFRKNSKAKAVTIVAKTALAKPEKIIYVKDLEPISKKEWRRASKAEDNQLTIMLFVEAKAGTEENFRKLYHIAMPQFRSEPGVVTYQLSQAEKDATQFITFEKFRSNDAFQYHLNFPPIQPVLDYLNTSIKKQPFQDGIHHLIEFAPLIRE